ncbi:MAG: hypothetical protein BJ554DRAFT_6050 [Olpidium bornovanus]|uniref:Uncharacterized protein n=1 Tax=Olpidium bornovanus TaxID=278681 RepID=A0A8H8DKI4_9FUNG|nr:MAG: hypothetical protein BJ554DRAFT_6050 [Olpidium bornovanus]
MHNENEYQLKRANKQLRERFFFKFYPASRTSQLAQPDSAVVLTVSPMTGKSDQVVYDFFKRSSSRPIHPHDSGVTAIMQNT